MNVSTMMDRLSYTYRLMFYCFMFGCVHGGDQDLSPSCEVVLMVRRGTALKAAPQQHVRVKCPVKHCGQPLNVTWCKLLDTGKCEQIEETENVEIMQNDKHAKDELTSFLTFKRISINDDGLYRCDLKGYKDEQISHTINISVSDLHQGVTNSHNIAVSSEPSSVAGNEEDTDLSWLPYFFICLSILVLVTTLTVFTLLRFYGWKRILTFNSTKAQEMSTRMIPDLPKGSAPSSLFLQTHLPFLNDTHSLSAAERTTSHPTLNVTQPAVANTAVESHVSDRAVYSVINHRQSVTPAREQQRTAATQQKNSEYASINVS